MNVSYFGSPVTDEPGRLSHFAVAVPGSYLYILVTKPSDVSSAQCIVTRQCAFRKRDSNELKVNLSTHSFGDSQRSVA